jgi:hypothetical protein
LPRQDCLLLNMPAFAGRTTVRAVFPHTALQSAVSTSGRIVNDFPRVIPSFALPLQSATPYRFIALDWYA